METNLGLLLSEIQKYTKFQYISDETHSVCAVNMHALIGTSTPNGVLC